MTINYYDESLLGSSIFFSSNSFIGKIVRLGGLTDRINGLKFNEFSHVATIVLQPSGRLGLLEALQPKVVINDLEERINTCKDEMVLCILNDKSQEKISTFPNTFKIMVNKYNGAKYNTLDSFLAGIDILPDNSWLSKLMNKFKKPMHCSYLDALIKQSCWIVGSEINCSECTPQDNYEFNIYKSKTIIKSYSN